MKLKTKDKHYRDYLAISEEIPNKEFNSTQAVTRHYYQEILPLTGKFKAVIRNGEVKL